MIPTFHQQLHQIEMIFERNGTIFFLLCLGWSDPPDPLELLEHLEPPVETVLTERPDQ